MAYKRKIKKSILPGLNVNIIELENGLRVVHKHVPFTRIVHSGYVFNVGSRDFKDGEMGLAHFIEHMIFKGTQKRKTYHVLNYIESVGGELNAYTEKEKTCIYASVTSEHTERAVDLLTDIAFNSIFPEKEIEKEKQVISEEIDLYRNAPDEAIFEDFDKLIFPEHLLGEPILGTKESIRGFNREMLQSYITDHFTGENIVFALIGDVSDEEVAKLIDKYLRHLSLPSGKPARKAPASVTGKTEKVMIGTGQAHEIIGGRAPALMGGHYYSFMLINNMLGGPAMNSRLNLNIREKHGLTYSIHSFYSPFLDSGIWGIYYACEPKSLNRIHRLVKKELHSLRTDKLGSLRLHQMKKQLIGQFTLGYENLLSQMLGMAKDVLDYGETLPFNTHIHALDQVTVEDVLYTSAEVFEEDALFRLSYLPKD